MNALGWMHRKFTRNSDEQSRSISTGKPNSCFSAQWEFDDQQYYPTTKNNAANCRKPRVSSESSVSLEARSVGEAKVEETSNMSHVFFHGFLAIGTLGSISVTDELSNARVAMPFESETDEGTKAAEDKLPFLTKKLETINEKEAHDAHNELSKGTAVKETKDKDPREHKIVGVHPVKEYIEMPVPKEAAKEQKIMQATLFKKTVASNKRSGKLDKGEKRESKGLHFMKKMLKTFDFVSRSSPTSAACNAKSTEKKPSKVFRKSRRIHPEAVDDTTSHKYEVNNTCYDKGVEIEDEEIIYPHDGMLKKEIASRSLNSQPTGTKAHWIKTDADYLVLEF